MGMNRWTNYTSLIALLLAAFFLLTGCGQKGPLYLPDDTQKSSSPAK